MSSVPDRIVKYHVVAIGRLPDGRIQILGGGDVQYELDEDTAWMDLNELIDDPELPPPEPVQRAQEEDPATEERTQAAAAAVEAVASEVYGPVAGKLVRNGVVSLAGWWKRRTS